MRKKDIHILKKKNHIVYFFKNEVWDQRTYDQAHFPLRPRARAEEDSCRGQVGKGQIA